MTWPLLQGLASDVPADLGDSLLNMWILGWGAENLPRVVTGEMSLHDFWNANIFHPEPLALSFSEHLFGQVLQILPVYHLTGNLILAYNLLFLSSFVLSGLGMFLLVRDLLVDERGEGGIARSDVPIVWAALIAGLIYSFVPVRIAQVAHIQSVSSQWMPFALWGFRRFIATRNRVEGRTNVLPLVGGTAALLMQNWSCGYYLIYFSPFVLLFVVHQIFAANRAREWRVWAAFGSAALVVVAGTWPFLSMYLEAQRIHTLDRSIGEVIRFSADVYSYFTAPEALRVWGDVMQMYPKPEGELFFGIVPMVLGLIAIMAMARPKAGRTTVAEQASTVVGPDFSRTLPWILGSMIVIQSAGLIAILLTGGFVISLGGITIRATNVVRLVAGVVAISAALLAISSRARQSVRVVLRSSLALAVVLMLLALWLSLGPVAHSRGQALPGLGLYRIFYEHVPGFEGLRVPARYAMVAAVFLAIVAGYGARALLMRVRLVSAAAVTLATIFLVEVAFLPMPVNQTWGDGGVTPPPMVEPAARAPAVYRALASLPNAGVVTEFPFGDPAWELRFVYYSTVHWKRLVNGYSGGFPHGYKVRVARLQRIAEDPAAAWQTMIDAGTTHVIVHDSAYPPGSADVIHSWLTAHGAIEIGRFDSDLLYAVAR